MNLRKLTTVAALVVAMPLLVLNLYGLTGDIRMDQLDRLDAALVRFENENYLSYDQSIAQLDSIESYESTDFVVAATDLVHDSLTHIKWNRVDSRQFRQLIPAWDNYFLFLVGTFSGLPQFERYHFVSFRRSLERGIGICGDASMVLSQLLDRQGIENDIVSFRGHVINRATLDDGRTILLDADYGVIMDLDLETLTDDPATAVKYYMDEGYRDREANVLVRIYRTPFAVFESVFDFMPKRFVFEYVSYAMKWLLPLGLLAVAFVNLRGAARR